MMRRWALVALLAAGCKSGPSEDQCKELLDHLVDLEFKKAGAAAATDVQKQEIARQKTSLVEAKTTEFMETCTQKTSRSRVECAIAASDLDTGVAKCDENK
ncbi:MAG TPA: hypothetical protein VGO00_27045 [Kofleriaceae bacterium]|jgi:hypothetical protein|nr:hypothetical protein [Kofleriaceae bacterium]